MIARQHRVVRITTNVTTTFVAVTCFLARIVIHCKNAGTAWTLEIRDKASPARSWHGPYTLTLPADGKATQVDFVESTDPRQRHGHLMEGGIDVITAGTTPGEVAVAMEYGIPGG